MLTRRIEPIGGAFGRPHTAAQPHEDRGVGNLAHRDIRNRDVFNVRAVHGFQGEAARAVEDHVRDRDIAEVSFRFRADLDAPGRAVAVGCLFDGALVSAVQERADIVPADQTVGDGDVFRRAREAQRVRTLEDDRVVVGRIDAAIGYAHIAARVEVDAVPVGIDGQVVDGEVVHAGGEDAEVSAVHNRKIAQRHLTAELEGDRFVAAAAAFPARQSLTANQAAAQDRDVFESLAPDQAVVEMAVPEILKLVPLVGLRRVVSGWIRRCFQCGTGLELQGEIAAQANRTGQVGSRGEIHRPAARRRRGLDRLVDGGAVGSLAIALRPVRLYVEDAGAELPRNQPQRKQRVPHAMLPTVCSFHLLVRTHDTERPCPCRQAIM